MTEKEIFEEAAKELGADLINFHIEHTLDGERIVMGLFVFPDSDDNWYAAYKMKEIISHPDLVINRIFKEITNGRTNARSE